MNYWLINPKNNGSYTNLSDLKSDCVCMGWDENDCPKFYNDVKKEDVIIVAEGSHGNSSVHFIGIAEKLEKDKKCWHILFSTKEKNEEVAKIIRDHPSAFGGGVSNNPWGPSKSIIRLGNNSAEQQIKQILKQYFSKAKMNERIQKYKTLLEKTHNLILTGAPGTGKTYLAKQIAQKMIFGAVKDKMSEDEERRFNEHCGFVQFHPSYDYTDFVEGLRPIEEGNGNVGFEYKKGVFKAFCANVLRFNKVDFDYLYNTVVDDIRNRLIEKYTTLSGKVYPLKEEGGIVKYGCQSNGTDYRSENIDNIKLIYQYFIEHPKDIVYSTDGLRSLIERLTGGTVKTLDPSEYSWTIKELLSRRKPFVFIIDEINRGEISKIFGELFFSIDPGYRGKDGMVETQYQNLIEDGDTFKKGFFVPENVYIIGTMNDIDRSVESMDFAMRRRFAWKEVTAEDSMQMLDGLDNADEMKARMEKINDEILRTPGLGKAYQIGAAYFKRYELYNDFDLLWEYHLEGLLFEYLRGTTDIDKTMKKLADAYGYTKSNKYEPTSNN
ncbi:MAG: AAA family ATPase [Paludibacteraceae bacterium]|nr:AAA family ATPase [Paludibacteraceae bacterium]